MLWVFLLLVFSQVTGCSTTRTASGDIASESQTLELKNGDKIRVVTSQRERFKMVITKVQREGLAGKTLNWEGSDVTPDQEIYLPYSDLAFIQIDTLSPLKTAGLVASVTIIGGLIAAVAAAPVAVVVP